MSYDYLIVGAGLFGSIFAHEATKRGKKCLVIEKRDHIGGNCYTQNVEGINIHKYGAHIFHTSNKTVWNYIQQFAEFNRFTHCDSLCFICEGVCWKYFYFNYLFMLKLGFFPYLFHYSTSIKRKIYYVCLSYDIHKIHFE